MVVSDSFRLLPRSSLQIQGIKLLTLWSKSKRILSCRDENTKTNTCLDTAPVAGGEGQNKYINKQKNSVNLF